MNWYLKAFENYANFSGRARRKEYFAFQIVNALVTSFIIVPLIESGEFEFLAYGYVLTMVIPLLSVTVRRLHDIGRTGWHVLIGAIPFIGGVIILWWVFQDSEKGNNEWGPNPKDLDLNVEI